MGKERYSISYSGCKYIVHVGRFSEIGLLNSRIVLFNGFLQMLLPTLIHTFFHLLVAIDLSSYLKFSYRFSASKLSYWCYYSSLLKEMFEIQKKN